MKNLGAKGIIDSYLRKHKKTKEFQGALETPLWIQSNHKCPNSRIIEEGHGSTFELHHTLLSCKTANRITLPISVLNFRFLRPTVPKL